MTQISHTHVQSLLHKTILLISVSVLFLLPYSTLAGDGHNHGDESFATQSSGMDSFELTPLQMQNLGLKSILVQKHLFYESLSAPAVLKYPSFEATEIQAQGFIPEGYDFATLKRTQKVMLTLDAYPNQSFEGTVIRIDPMMDTKSRLYTFWATLKNPPSQSAGLKGVINVQTGDSEEAIGIPQNALNGEFGNWFVFVKKETHFERRPVLIGHTMGHMVEIAAGLKINEEVVTTGSYQLQYVSGTQNPTDETDKHAHTPEIEEALHKDTDELHTEPHAHPDDAQAHLQEHIGSSFIKSED